MTFTTNMFLISIYCNAIQVFIILAFLNHVRSSVCQWYHDSILKKKSRLRRAEKSTKHILNSIYKEFKSRVNQSLAAAEHKLRYGCPYGSLG